MVGHHWNDLALCNRLSYLIAAILSKKLLLEHAKVDSTRVARDRLHACITWSVP